MIHVRAFFIELLEQNYSKTDSVKKISSETDILRKHAYVQSTETVKNWFVVFIFH